MPPAQSFQRTIILSVFIILFLHAPVISKAAAAEPAPQPDNFVKLAADAERFADDSERNQSAGGTFISNVRAAVAAARNACPPDFPGLIKSLQTIAIDVEASLVEAKILKAQQAKIARRFADADKHNKLKLRKILLDQLNEIAPKIAEAEARAVMPEKRLKAFTAVYAPCAGLACPKNSIMLDGTFCIDKYELPNEKDTLPKTGLTYGQAKKACEDAGKRVCTGKEWLRACDGHACKPNRVAMPNFHAADCNPALNVYVDRKTQPSGAASACPTPEGVEDLFGNAWEWVDEDYKNFYKIARGGAGKNDRIASCVNTAWGTADVPKPYFGVRCCTAPAIQPTEPPQPAPSAAATQTASMPQTGATATETMPQTGAQPPAEAPAAPEKQQPAEKKAAEKKPAEKQPAAQKPSEKKPSTEVKKATEKKPATERKKPTKQKKAAPAEKQPATQKPAEKKPASWEEKK